MTREFKSIAKILLADDDYKVQEAIKWACEREGIELIPSLSGLDVIDLAIVNSPDVIVLTIELPEVDGITLLKRLKSIQGLKEIPVLIFTTHDSEAIQEECKRLGAKGVIRKTECLHDLGERLSQITTIEAANNLCRKTSVLLKCTQRHMTRLGKGLGKTDKIFQDT